MPGGRPSDYTPELAETICERVLMRPLRQVCMDADMPGESAVYVWLGKHPEFAEKYARARSLRAFRRVEDMDELAGEIKSGAVDPQTGRVLMDAIKWQAGRENPKFGERTTLAGDPEAPLQTHTRIEIVAVEAKAAE